MEIEKLQQAWSQLSSKQSSEKELDENGILKILNSRTTNAIDRIDWNIRIGLAFLIFLFFVLPLLILLFDRTRFDYEFTHDVNIPGWIFDLGIVSFSLLYVLLGLFVFNYYHVKNSCRGACSLRTTLIRTIRILKLYFRLFGFGFFIVFLTGVSAFSAGFFEGYHISGGSLKFQLIGLLFLVIIVGSATGILFLLFRWIFRRMYGKYTDSLKQNLKELDELNGSDPDV